MKLSIAAIIPARWKSSRFPGKPLAPILGQPMLQRVWRRVQAAQVDQVIVATDSERIMAFCHREGMPAMMTKSHHPTGTDRIAEVAAQVPADIYVNVQGDEPLIEPISIDRVVQCLQQHLGEGCSVATGYIEGATEEQRQNPNIVHLVPNQVGRVMLFSRASVPFSFRQTAASTIHVGLYAFTRAALLNFAQRQKGPVERAESIELLRFLEYGDPIACVPVLPGSMGVDCPEDIALVESKILADSKSS
jgi:3-deoxy-manno-octulosonate cytidylyltransferase (CMP-KDO synthetase)